MKHPSLVLYIVSLLYHTCVQAVVVDIILRGKIQTDLLSGDIVDVCNKPTQNYYKFIVPGNPFNWVSRRFRTPDITEFNKCITIKTSNLNYDSSFAPIVESVATTMDTADSEDPIGAQKLWAIALYNSEDCTMRDEEDVPLQMSVERTWHKVVTPVNKFPSAAYTTIFGESEEHQRDLRSTYRSLKLIDMDEWNKSKGKVAQMFDQEGQTKATVPATFKFGDYALHRMAVNIKCERDD